MGRSTSTSPFTCVSRPPKFVPFLPFLIYIFFRRQPHPLPASPCSLLYHFQDESNSRRRHACRFHGAYLHGLDLHLGQQAQLHPIIGPTERPNATTTDPWTCVTESVRERYFNDSPRPSGALDKALISYGSQLPETCKTAGTYYSRPCAFPDKTRRCGVRWYMHR